MMNKAWRKMLAAGCVVSLLMSIPRVSVIAGELHDEEFIVELAEEPEIIGENADLVVEAEDADEIIEEYVSQIDETEELDEVDNFEEQFDDEVVGAGNILVGENVTASFDTSTGAVEFYSNGGTLWRDWLEKSGIDVLSIKSIKIASGKIYLPKDSSCVFGVGKYMNNGIKSNLSYINLAGFDTSNVTNMRGMFENCTNLTTLDLSSFNTSKVTDMCYMFYECNQLINVDLSSFNTSKVTDMSSMFYRCNNLKSLDISNFDTTNVTDMGFMFTDCYSLTDLDLINFNTSKVKDMTCMFQGCKSLVKLNVSSFNTTSVSDMSFMFYRCYNLTELDVSGFDTSNVTRTNSMFTSCESLSTLDVSGFITSNVTDMYEMFDGCESLTQLDVSKFDTSKVTDMSHMFDGCESLTQLDVSKFDTSKVTDMSYMFGSCDNLINLDVSRFNTSNVTNMSNMIACSNTKLDVSNFDTSKVTDMSYMFSCAYLTSLDLSNFNTSKVTDMRCMFRCGSLTKVNVSSFDTSSVTNMRGMFEGCGKLTSLDLSSFDMYKVTYADEMLGVYNSLNKLKTLKTPKNNSITDICFPYSMYDSDDNKYEELPTVSKSIDLKRAELPKCSISISPASFTYDGDVKQPIVKVKNCYTDLIKDIDYRVSYSNNINAGTASVTVTGIEYIGKVEKTFSIVKAMPSLKFASSNITKKTTDAAFTNALTKTTDGTVTFKSSNTGVATVNSTSGKVTIKGVGTTTITATATEGTNYKAGSASYTLIVVKGSLDISGCTVTLSTTSYTYNGKEKKPAVTVKDGTKTLTLDTDYTVEYGNNINAGTAVATVTGIGTYTGTNSATFTIKKAAPTLKFASDPVRKKPGDAAFTNKLTYKTDGALTYSSGSKAVATVNSTSGRVTVKGEGSTKITVKAAEGANYKAGTASYTLIVSRNGVGSCSYSFSNSAESFGYPKSYVIPLEAYYRIYGKNTRAEYTYKTRSQKEWGGNCVGMASTADLLARGSALTPGMFRSGAALNSELAPTDKSSALGISLTQLIESFQIMQYTTAFSDERYGNMVATYDILNSGASLDALYADIKKRTAAGERVILVMAQNGEGHAVLAYGTSEPNTGSAEILIYDNNHPQVERKVNLKKGGSGKYTEWSYDMGSHGVWGTGSFSSYMTYITEGTFDRLWENRGNVY